MFVREDTLTNKIGFWHVLLFAASLPFDRFYSELILISFLIHTLIHFRKSQLNGFPARRVLLLQSVFLVTVLATLHTAYFPEAFKIWELQLAIFLFPLLLAMAAPGLAKYRTHVLTAFAGACMLAVAYLEWDALRIIQYNHLGYPALLSEQFLNHNFSSPLGIHPTYLSMYVALSIICLLFSVFPNRAITGKIVCIGCALLLSASLLQLGSRSVMLAFLLLMALLPFFFRILRYNRKMVFVSMVVIASTVVVVYRSDSLKKRFISDMVKDITYTEPGHTRDEYRIVRWEAAVGLIRRSPLIGFGTGSEIDLLKKEYYNRKMYNSYLLQFNTHNQYLGLAVTAGIAGLAVFIGTLFIGFRAAIKRKDFILLGFLVIIATVSFSENILSVNKGIFFYGFFFPLLLFFSSEAGSGLGMQRQPCYRKKRLHEQEARVEVPHLDEPALPWTKDGKA